MLPASDKPLRGLTTTHFDLALHRDRGQTSGIHEHSSQASLKYSTIAKRYDKIGMMQIIYLIREGLIFTLGPEQIEEDAFTPTILVGSHPPQTATQNSNSLPYCQICGSIQLEQHTQHQEVASDQSDGMFAPTLNRYLESSEPHLYDDIRSHSDTMRGIEDGGSDFGDERGAECRRREEIMRKRWELE